MSALQNIHQKLEQMSPRERNIILVASIALLVFLWDLLLFAPLQKQSANLEQQINALQANMTTQSQQMLEVMQATTDDPNKELKQRKPQLEKSIDIANQRILELTARLIPPQQMAEVLEQVLRQETQLSLVKVINVPGKQISPDVKQPEGTEATAVKNLDNAVLYQHGVELQLEGEYFQTMRYLKALEKMPWQVLWSELEYEVQEYPRAQIRLIINTLSTDSGWIGV